MGCDIKFTGYVESACPNLATVDKLLDDPSEDHAPPSPGAAKCKVNHDPGRWVNAPTHHTHSPASTDSRAGRGRARQCCTGVNNSVLARTEHMHMHSTPPKVIRLGWGVMLWLHTRSYWPPVLTPLRCLSALACSHHPPSIPALAGPRDPGLLQTLGSLRYPQQLYPTPHPYA